MNRARLATLAAHLETVPQHNFNMNAWCSLNGAKLRKGAIPKPTCNTRACAGGWACSIPEFNKAGLHLEDSYGNTEPAFKGSYGAGALRRFFDLDIEQSDAVFMPHRNMPYDDPIHVSKVIYKMLTK